MDAEGNFIIAWAHFPNSDRLFDIYARCYNAAGAALGDEFLVSDAIDGNDSLPSVAMNASGEFVVAWQDDNSPKLFARQNSATGAPRGGEFQVNTTSSGTRCGDARPTECRISNVF